jgi:hypothetical protein
MWATPRQTGHHNTLIYGDGSGAAASIRDRIRVNIRAARPRHSTRPAPILRARGRSFCQSAPRPIFRNGAIKGTGPPRSIGALIAASACPTTGGPAPAPCHEGHGRASMGHAPVLPPSTETQDGTVPSSSRIASRTARLVPAVRRSNPCAEPQAAEMPRSTSPNCVCSSEGTNAAITAYPATGRLP